MRNILLLIITLFFTASFAQSYGDGCMSVQLVATQAWNEEYEDPFFNDESNWQWWFADVANIDGLGWVGGQCLVQGGFFQIGFWNHSDVTVYNYSFGAAGPNATTVPFSFSLRGHYEGDDCGGSCDYCTSLFDDDDYRYDETVSTGINYRFAPPNQNNTFQRFTNWHGSSDFGGEFYARYTSPRPLVSANTTQICVGTATNITLSFSGAVFGGNYQVLDGATVVYNGSVSSTTLSVSSSKTYNVYTSNGGTRSLCYSTININAVNCTFNCVTKANQTWIASFDVSAGNSPSTSFTAPGNFPVNSYISDINVDINYLKTDGSCATPLAGSAYHGETHFALQNSTLGSISLVQGNFIGNTALVTPITMTFDEDAIAGVTGYDVTVASNGVVLNPIGNLDAWNWNLINPAQTWDIRGGDDVALDPLCTNFYNLTVCGCKSADYGIATVNSSSSTITICADDPGTITLAHNGSTSGFDNDGFGDELRWYSGSCGGTYIGSGLSISVLSPTATTTYYASFYIEGVPCRGSNTFCESITVSVNPTTIPGTISPVTQTICVSSVPSPLILTGYTGTILGWEYSSDGGGTWSTASGSSSSASFSLVPYASIPGLHTFRANVKNGVCDVIPSNPVTLIVNPNPIAGSVNSSTLILCSDSSFVVNANGYTGSIQWQVSTTNATTGFSNLSGQTSPSYGTSISNLGVSNLSYWYRAAVNNPPCAATVFSAAVEITINPVTLRGVVSGATTTICVGGNPGNLSLTGHVGAIQNWLVSFNGGAQTNIVNTNSTYAPGILPAAGTFSYSAVVQSGACKRDTSTAFTVTVQPAVLVSISGLDSVCQGASITLSASASGGVGGYAYQWQINGVNVGPNSSSYVTSTALPAATYSYTVTVNAGSCSTMSATKPVIVNPRPVISNITTQNLQCYGQNIGSINIIASADSFSINNGLNYQVSNSFTALASGNYDVLVKNSFGCIQSYAANPIVIAQPDSIMIYFTILEPNCATSNDGAISVNASGGTPNYEYAIGGGAFQSGNNFAGLTPGTYTIAVRDNNNCIYTKDTTLTAQYTFDLVLDSLKNVSCPGSADGYIELGTVGGIAPFSFSNDNAIFQSDSVYNNLVAGPYTFYASDINGCTDVLSASILESSPIHIELDSVRQLLCFGDANASIFITTTGSTVPYNFAWRLNGVLVSNQEDLLNVSAGIYNLTVNTTNSCIATIAVQILNPLQLNATTTGTTNATCFGLSNGLVQASVNGGTPAYTYVWTDASSAQVGTSQNLSGVGVGTYTLTVTDANGCTATSSGVVAAPTAIAVNGITTDPSCANSNDGEITISARGGTAPYTYALNGGATQTNSNFAGLSAGTYSLNVTDANGCTATGTATLVNQYTLSLAVQSQTNVSCAGQNDGSVTLATTGGQAAFSYTINGGGAQASNVFSGLAPGLYTFGVSDANGCSATTSATITSNPLLVMNLDSTTNVLCNGQSTGAIYVSAIGGQAPLSYAINGGVGQVSGNFTGLAAGNYNVVVTGQGGCITSITVAITAPSALSATTTGTTNVTCFGLSNGLVQASVNGGTPAYTYVWTDASSAQVGTSQNLSGVGVGTYTLTVTDANGCTATSSGVVAAPTAIAVNGITTDPSCANSNDGEITISARGGTAPYTYALNGGATQTNSNFAGLSAGTYSLNVTDANGCTATGTATLVNQYTLSLAVQSQTNVSCAGQNDGSVTLATTGGQAAFSYTINGGGAQASNVFSGLAPGLYTFGVSDANGCSATTSATITSNPPLVVSLDSVVALQCAGSNTGAVYITVSGGNNVYFYVWSNNTFNQDLINVAGGTYTVTVTDGAGCSQTLSAVVASPSTLSLVVANYGNVQCAGNVDGYVDVSAAGGVAPYTFSWSDGTSVLGNTEDLYSLGSGIYTLTVTDANACIAVISQTLTSPSALSGSLSISDESCFGDQTGTATANVIGGTAPYAYLWANFEITQSISGIGSGVISVVVTDAHSCQIFLSDTVQGPSAALAITLIRKTNVSCFGGNDGSLETVISGGTAPYTIVWNPGGMNTEVVDSLVAGVYIMTVTDANGCAVNASYTITQAPKIVTSVSVTNPTCNGQQTGMALVGASGGNAPYVYSWNTNPIQSGALANNLAGDTSYIVTVTDNNGCVVSDTAGLVNPVAMQITTTTQGVSCLANENGEVAVIVQGGNAPYTYQLNGLIQVDSVFENLAVGTYVIFVVDNNQCNTSNQFDIVQNPVTELQLLGAGNDGVFWADDLFIIRGEEVQLLADILSTGVAVVQANWSAVSSANLDTTLCGSPCLEPTMMPEEDLTVTVSVIDSNGCNVTDTLRVNVSQEAQFFMPTAFSPNGDCLNDNFEINVLGGTSLDVRIFNRWGEELFHNANQANGLTDPLDVEAECMSGSINPRNAWDGTYNNEPMPIGAYIYQVDVAMFDGTVKTMSGSVTILR